MNKTSLDPLTASPTLALYVLIVTGKIDSSRCHNGEKDNGKMSIILRNK